MVTLSERKRRREAGETPAPVITRGGKEFLLPERELRELERRGRIAPEETTEARTEVAAKEVRREEFQEVTGTPELRTELEQKTAEEPSLEPGAVSDIPKEVFGTTKGLSSAELAQLQREGRSPFTPEQEKARKKLAISATAVGIGAGFLPGLASSALALFSTTAGKVVTGIGTGAGAVGLIGGGFPGTQIGQGQIDTRRGAIQEMSESPTDVIGAVQSGLSAQEGIVRLRTMVEDIEKFEADIKTKAILNIKFRTEDQHLEIQKEILTARFAMLEAVNAIENIAVTGQVDADMENLLFYSNRLNDRTERLKNE